MRVSEHTAVDAIRSAAWPLALVGFTTYARTVTAASAWDGPAERTQVRKIVPNSYEAFFHNANLTRQFDAVLHFDISRAVEPLERTPQWGTGEWETFPSGV